MWDPLLAEQDKIFKKKEREDAYHSSHPTEEPILLIKKREIITKYIRPDEEQQDMDPSQIIKHSQPCRYVNVDYNTAQDRMASLTDA